MKKALRPFSTMTKSAFTLLPLLLVNVSDPVQSLLRHRQVNGTSR
jgi:hypothetical protein